MRDSSRHLGEDLTGITPTLAGEHYTVTRDGGWSVRLQSDQQSGWAGVPLVEVRVLARDESRPEGRFLSQLAANLTTGEARVLAAQLLRLADCADF